ncbi:MAG: biopolymer transporter ExbD [Sphaerochaeta sp.]
MRKRRDLGQPSDIAFLLIIFFLLLAGINTTQSIALHTSTSKEIQKDTVVVQALLTQQGTLQIEGESYAPFEFAARLTPNTTLHLQVEEETSWQQVVDLLSLTEQRQIAGLSLTLADDATTAISSQEEGKYLERQLQLEKQEILKQGQQGKKEGKQENTDTNTREMTP